MVLKIRVLKIPIKIQPKGDTMLKRQLGTLFLVTCLILTSVPALGKNTITLSF